MVSSQSSALHDQNYATGRTETRLKKEQTFDKKEKHLVGNETKNSYQNV